MSNHPLQTDMTKQRLLKVIHLLSTIWFILCTGYLLILALRQAGVHWWVIFSLSGHSAVLVFTLLSLYLFAFFRGTSRSQLIETEAVAADITVVEFEDSHFSVLSSDHLHGGMSLQHSHIL